MERYEEVFVSYCERFNGEAWEESKKATDYKEISSKMGEKEMEECQEPIKKKKNTEDLRTN